MPASFFDTNVLIYLFDEQDRHKSDIAKKHVSQALKTSDSIISFQVVQETLHVITKKLLVTATPEQADKFLIGILMPLWKINPSRELYQRGLHIQSRYRYGFYDALIIAAALEAGCRILYSEDLQHGQKIEQLTIKNPFLE